MTTFGLNIERALKKPRKQEEASLQVRLVSFLQNLLPKDAYYFAVPNGGSRNVIEATNLKRQGVRAGVPDLVIVYAGKVFGLELKSKAGKISDSQKVTFPLLRDAGMRIEVARDFNEALTLIAEMGIPLRTNDTRYAVRDVFREETRRRV